MQRWRFCGDSKTKGKMKHYDVTVFQLVLHVSNPELPLLPTVPHFLAFPGEEPPESRDQHRQGYHVPEEHMFNKYEGGAGKVKESNNSLSS